MALSDLLWACPACGEDRGLVPAGKDYRCRACATRYRRVQGASIRAERPDGSVETRRPAAWLDELPSPEDLVAQADNEDSVIRSVRVLTRWVTDSDTVHGENGYLNRIEIWGEEAPGTLELRADRLVYAADGAGSAEWPLASITAIQASSSSLQVNRRGTAPVSFRFQTDSIFLWEELLHAALRDFYRRTGRGTILEFQPRVVAR